VAVIDEEAATLLAEELLCAEDGATTVPPLTERHPGLTVDDAYAIQLRGRALRVGRGARVVGRKVGLTSAAMQTLLGVDEPDFGYLTDAMIRRGGDPIPLAGLVAPRVEAEIAFRLGTRVAGADVDLDTAIAAIAEVAPALEVVDSRVADWRIALPDTVADNASSGLAVLGEFRPRGELDLAAVEMTMRVRHADGSEKEESGPGSAVLGHPVRALVWLARALASYGEGIEAGEIVIPGAMARAVSIGAGAAVHADFTGLGQVAAHFDETKEA